MPALSSSPIDPAVGHLADLARDAADDPPGLLAVLAGVADPRHRRGIRRRLAVILALAVCAVLAGARSFTAIAEWAADADAQTLARLGVTGVVPSESTFRRTLQRLDAGAFDELAGRWAARRTTRGPGGRRVIAVDARPYAAPVTAAMAAATCWRRWTMFMAWCWARWRWAPRPTRCAARRLVISLIQLGGTRKDVPGLDG